MSALKAKPVFELRGSLALRRPLPTNIREVTACSLQTAFAAYVELSISSACGHSGSAYYLALLRCKRPLEYGYTRCAE